MVDNKREFPTPVSIGEQSTIGIDLGLKSFAATSDGGKVDAPKFLRKAEGKLKYLQRQASRKKKGSNNNKKAYKKSAIQHEKVANKRRDFLHKLSTELVKNHDTLCFEKLNVQGMVKNRKLAKSINDTGWGMFVEFCKYKALWYGKNFIQIGRFEPSTKICSSCGATNHTLTLADREWTCANCGTLHDRDINAAINIKNIALKNCGGVHREKPAELPTMVGAMKQEG